MRPAFPPRWSKTINDLLAEGRNIPGEEIEWARGFERQQLRSRVRFPRPGEVYELVPESDRNADGYAGYRLSFSTSDLNELFRPLASA